MYTLWSVRADGGNGKELYGEDYADIYAINRLHFKAASPADCDKVTQFVYYSCVEIVLQTCSHANVYTRSGLLPSASLVRHFRQTDAFLNIVRPSLT